MKNMTIENIVKACDGTFVGDEKFLSMTITGVEKDSRLVEEGFLYVPFVGARVDGHSFINELFETQHILASLSEKDLDDAKGPYIKVDSTFEALKKIASFYRSQLSCKVIGITGSVGKTSTKEIIASVLQEKFSVLKTEGNYNNEIGMPLTLLKIRDNHDIAVIEMGISHFNDMNRLAEIARPDISVITNIGTCHLEHLIDRDGVFRAKTEMFDHLSDNPLVVLNGDDDKLANVTEVKNTKPIFYGMDEKFDVRPVSYSSNGIDGTDLTISYFGQEFSTYIPVAGTHMIYNAMAAVILGKYFNMSFDEIDAGIRNLNTIRGRNHIIKEDNLYIIDDCYNANPMSMKASIDVLSRANSRKVAVLGDMFELGKDENELHGEVGEYINNKGIDLVICIGKLSKNIFDKVSDGTEKIYFEDKSSFLINIKDYININDTVLVKASNGMKFTEIVDNLKGLKF